MIDDNGLFEYLDTVRKERDVLIECVEILLNSPTEESKSAARLLLQNIKNRETVETIKSGG